VLIEQLVEDVEADVAKIANVVDDIEAKKAAAAATSS
jgi:hypothetical protein